MMAKHAVAQAEDHTLEPLDQIQDRSMFAGLAAVDQNAEFVCQEDLALSLSAALLGNTRGRPARFQEMGEKLRRPGNPRIVARGVTKQVGDSSERKLDQRSYKQPTALRKPAVSRLPTSVFRHFPPN